MADYSSYKPTEAKEVPKSSIQSGTEREEVIKYCGGMPPKKDVSDIEKVNSPDARKRAPGSVGF